MATITKNIKTQLSDEKDKDKTERQRLYEGKSLSIAEEFLSRDYNDDHDDYADEDDDEEYEEDDALVEECNNIEVGCLDYYNSISQEFNVIEKSVIIHRDENGFGLRVKGHSPVFIEHVHENGAAWRVGVRKFDRISKVNGTNVFNFNHKDVVLMFKSCSRFVGLTLLSNSPTIRNIAIQFSSMNKQAQQTDFTLNSNNLNNSVINEYNFSTNARNNVIFNNQIPHKQLMNNIHHHRQLSSRSLQLDSKNINSNNNKVINITATQSPTIASDMKNPLARIHPHLSPSLAARRAGSVTSRPQQLLHKKTCSNSREQTINVNCNCIQPSTNPNMVINRLKNCETGSLKVNNNRSQNVQIKINSHQIKTNVNLQQQRPTVVNKRLEIIKEFIDTEKTHTDRLKFLDELFYKPLKSGKLITNEQLKMVFSCHRTLYKLHKQIYRTLLSVNYDLYSEPMIGSALIEIFEGDIKRRLEKAACSFCVSQSTNVELLNKLTRRDTKVGHFLAQVTSQQMIGRLGIKDLLASCFQRLTKYPLLLESLLKATPTTPPPAPSKSNEKKSNIHKRCLLIYNQDEADYNEIEQEEDSDNEEEEDEESVRNSRRMLAISLAEEREFIERALHQSRQMLIKVNDAVQNAQSRNKLRDIWKKTERYPGIPEIDISKQNVIHEGTLTLRLAKRSFDVYVLLLNDYIIILTREGQDKYKLKFFTPEGKSNSSNIIMSPPIITSSTFVSSIPGDQHFNYSATSNNLANSSSKPNQLLPNFPTINLQQQQQQQQQQQTPQVFSPIFFIDEHLTTRDVSTDENGFYLLCKRRDDSRMYEFASKSPAERMKWRDKIQLTIERQMSKQSSMSLSSSNNNNHNNNSRRQSSESTITRSSSDISCIRQEEMITSSVDNNSKNNNSTIGASKCNNNLQNHFKDEKSSKELTKGDDVDDNKLDSPNRTGLEASKQTPNDDSKNGPTKIEGTISYVEDDGIVMPSKMESSKAFVDQAIQVNVLDASRKPLTT